MSIISEFLDQLRGRFFKVNPQNHSEEPDLMTTQNPPVDMSSQDASYASSQLLLNTAILCVSLWLGLALLLLFTLTTENMSIFHRNLYIRYPLKCLLSFLKVCLGGLEFSSLWVLAKSREKIGLVNQVMSKLS